jgi:hypothetical protein
MTMPVDNWERFGKAYDNALERASKTRDDRIAAAYAEYDRAVTRADKAYNALMYGS